MGHLILRQQSPPAAAIPLFSQSGFFFNDARHLGGQSRWPCCVITALNETGQADARCAFFRQPNGAVSPGAAPFGSVEFIQSLPDAVLNELLDALVDEAKGSARLKLVNYPHCYAPEQAHRLTQERNYLGTYFAMFYSW